MQEARVCLEPIFITYVCERRRETVCPDPESIRHFCSTADEYGWELPCNQSQRGRYVESTFVWQLQVYYVSRACCSSQNDRYSLGFVWIIYKWLQRETSRRPSLSWIKDLCVCACVCVHVCSLIHSVLHNASKRWEKHSADRHRFYQRNVEIWLEFIILFIN